MEAITSMKKDNLKKNETLVKLPRNKSYEQNLSSVIFDPNNSNHKLKFIEKLELRYNKFNIKS